MKVKEKYIILGLMIAILITISLLVYNNFKTKYTIKLLGAETVNLYLYESYIEPGYQAYDRDGNDVSNQVLVSSEINTTKEGTYIVKYQLGKEIKYREVNVTNDPKNEIQMGLESNNNITLWKDSIYKLPMVYAMDKIDGDISDKIIMQGAVDISTCGIYNIKYIVTNSRNVSREIELTVNVVDFNYSYEEMYLGNKYVGYFTIKDDLYNKIVLPDYNESTNKEISYIYNENKDYTFFMYDKYNNYKEITINIKGVDLANPTLNCKVYLYDNNSKVVVDANDDIGIKEYKYQYNGKNEILTVNNHTYYDDTSAVTVIVEDYAGNSSQATCSIIDESTRYGRSYTQEENGYKYWLYIPPTLTKRRDVPLVIFIHGRGECGNNPNLINRNSFPKYINEGTNYDFVMIAPLVPENACYSADTAKVKNIIDNIIQRYNLNEKRVFVTGFSYGAKNTYLMVNAYPNFFAGAIAVAFDPPFRDYSNLLTTPILAFHGTSDARYEEHMKAINTISKSNPNSKFISFKGVNHENTPSLVYKDNQEVLDFIATTYR